MTIREASTGESAAAVSIYHCVNTHSQRKFIINIIIVASPADKSVCWTKYLTKLPKISVLDLANYLLQNLQKKKLKTEVMSSIIVIFLHHFSVSICLYLNIKGRFH